MRWYNIVLGIGMFGLWIYSLVSMQDVLVSIGLGICSVIMFSFDDLLYKPINIIGFSFEEKSEHKKKKEMGKVNTQLNKTGGKIKWQKYKMS